MKEPNKQIFSMLQAFSEADVLKAIELYQTGLKNRNETAKQELIKDGWLPQNSKPENREFYFFDNLYWVQTDESRQKHIEEQIAVIQARKKVKVKKYTGQKMDLTTTDIVCPECQSKMYKQSVCGGCKEGRMGFKIRLICEENPDHEVLL